MCDKHLYIHCLESIIQKTYKTVKSLKLIKADRYVTVMKYNLIVFFSGTNEGTLPGDETLSRHGIVTGEYPFKDQWNFP